VTDAIQKGDGAMTDHPFLRDSENDPLSLNEACVDPQSGLHRFFRLSTQAMQARFCELADPASIPTAFVHGNPHLDNYAKTQAGAAMVDFDRARFGPYAYDIARFLISVSLRRARRGRAFLHPVVLDSFRRGYLFGLSGLGHEEMGKLRDKPPKKWQKSTRAYVQSKRRWSARLTKHAIDHRAPRVRTLLRSYLKSRDELDILDTHRLDRAAEVEGSMGKLHLLLLLTPLDHSEDQRLVDVKETYIEPDDQFFFSPFDHEGRRMVEAGKLHAPGWEIRPGWASYGGKDYWCREIPTQSLKLKRPLEDVEQVDLCFSVATQLGRAHRASMQGVEADAHATHFASGFGDWVALSEQMKRELEMAHMHYVGSLGMTSLRRTG
jgi:uncharacterized protein (DUF2252 family)